MAPVRPHRVLVVDDDPGAVDLLALLLESEGFEPRTATSVGDATEVADTWEPHSLVTDVNLPDGTGLELAGVLRQRQPALFAVALSGLEASLVRGMPGAAHVQHVVTKPLDFEALVQLLRGAQA